MPKARFAIDHAAGRASGTGVVVTGAKELDALLDALPKKIQNKIVRDALRKAAKPIQLSAKANAPVDKGELRRSITIRKGKRAKKGRQSIVIFPDIAKFKDDFHAPFLEYGTSTIAPHPYMRPAFEANKDRAMAIIQGEIMKAVLAARAK